VGTFRRNPWLKIAWSEKLGEQMARKQETILETSSQYVKPGGRLVYATCSLMQQENEDVIEQFLSDNPEFSLLPASEILKKQGIHLDCQSPFLMLLPHHTGTDGFFAAVMARTR
jgi:16S rRNA (cytosine967-C5)-methyltransferase